MRIGIDIDNVISNFNDELLKAYLNHDKELRNVGIINENAKYIRNGMFDWTNEEEISFYKNNIEEIAKNLSVLKDAERYVNKLHLDGNYICIISGRDNGEYSDPYVMTKNWLAKNNIHYDKLVLTNGYDKKQKASVCLKNNINIMIDDSASICDECEKNGIDVVLMDTPYNKQSTLNRVRNWKEIYDYVSRNNMSKINVILDTDAYNECDDQFAISYILRSQDVLNIEAITIAPYSHKSINVSVSDGQDLSYKEINKICNWLNFNTDKVFKGSMGYLQNGYSDDNKAVNKIIEIALKNDKTYILGIGAITNLAIAIKKEPKIINKIEVIWLGGNEIGYKNNLEYNFKQDVEAVKVVFESKVKMTILPCKNVVSELRININTLKNNLGSKSELCNYLIERFYNDGYHGLQESRVIWDISAIAYMINKHWFKTKEVSCPNIRDDTSYEITNNRHNITFVTKLDRDKIYEDLFMKLGDN